MPFLPRPDTLPPACTYPSGATPTHLPGRRLVADGRRDTENAMQNDHRIYTRGRATFPYPILGTNLLVISSLVTGLPVHSTACLHAMPLAYLPPFKHSLPCAIPCLYNIPYQPSWTCV